VLEAPLQKQRLKTPRGGGVFVLEAATRHGKTPQVFFSAYISEFL
jgi:hypothetical protein